MRKIIHIDMDCFYAAVEEKHHPELKGKPLGIGGPPNSRSVLCTANYEARKFGVRAALPSSQAVRLCPQLIIRPPNFDLYKLESQKVREIFERFTHKIEPLSLDEAYLDVTDCSLFYGSATLIAMEIKRLILVERQLTASAGISSNKFLAKIASDWKKPNGLFLIKPDEISEFVKKLPVEKMFGVGKVTAKKLHSLGIKTCQDIQNLDQSQLHKHFGSRALDYLNMAHGKDDRTVVTEWERKSISVETTFSKDIFNLDLALKEIPELYQDWLERFERSGDIDRIKGWSVKLKFQDFSQTTIEESHKSIPRIQDFELLLRKVWQRKQQPIRLLGLGVKLATTKQADPNDEIDLPLFQLDYAV